MKSWCRVYTEFDLHNNNNNTKFIKRHNAVRRLQRSTDIANRCWHFGDKSVSSLSYATVVSHNIAYCDCVCFPFAALTATPHHRTESIFRCCFRSSAKRRTLYKLAVHTKCRSSYTTSHCKRGLTVKIYLFFVLWMLIVTYSSAWWQRNNSS